MKFQIKHRITGDVLFECKTGSLTVAVEAAVAAKANLRHADLRHANLRHADLRSAGLRSADLRYADLRSADLRYANLRHADLGYAKLGHADLRSAGLRSADLRSADLRYADLRYADLRHAKLGYADLRSADLGYSKLIDAGQDRRGYRFIAQRQDDGYSILAGCHNFPSITKASNHWLNRHKDNLELHIECLAKLDLIEAVAKARGWAVETAEVAT